MGRSTQCARRLGIWFSSGLGHACNQPLICGSAARPGPRGWRLADLRQRRGPTQAQVAARMGVSIARISQIEVGGLSTQDVLARYVSALGGALNLIADFGDEQLKIA
jgi:hypothetical protein